MMPAIPVTIVGGYLGAGKTTLINALLRNSGGRRLAVLVNEFGALPIDADLIEARDGNLISISGGCVCCSFGSDLVAALIDLTSRSQPIDHLLIETSGVALPGSIAQSIALLPGLAMDGVIVLADVETVEQLAADRYVGGTVRGQLAVADIILLNKIDLAASEHVVATTDWLSEIKPGACILPVQNACIAPDIILGAYWKPGPDRGVSGFSAHDILNYDAISLEIEGRVDAEALAHALSAPRLGLLRAKGFVWNKNGELVVLHVVGRRTLVEPAPSRIEGPARLVCIGLAAQMNCAAISAAIQPGSLD